MNHSKKELKWVEKQVRGKETSGYRGSWGLWFYGGEQVRLLEKEWAEKFGVKHAIACNSATSGLWLACAAAGLGTDHYFSPGQYTEYVPNEVLVTPYSMTCSASIPLHFGALPVFADIEPDYFCLDPDDVERKITENTRAIIVVDLFGMPYDADRINAIAKKHNIIVIEDAAQACGATYNGKYAGTLGDIGVYSFNVHKWIECGEGGMVVTNDDETAMRIRMIMNHAEAVNNDLQDDRYNHLVGMNMRIGSERQAASIRWQLANALDKRMEFLRNIAEDFPVKVRDLCDPAYYRYAWRVKDATNEQIAFLNGGRIKGSIFNFKKHYIKPIFQMPLFQHLGYDQDQCPVCREVDEDIILAWPKNSI